MRELLRQASSADGAVGEEGDVAARALFGHGDRLAKVRGEAVLHGDDRQDLLRFLDLLDRDVAQAEPAELARAVQFREGFDAPLERDPRVGSVELVEIDALEPELLQAGLERAAQVLGAAVLVPAMAARAGGGFRFSDFLVSRNLRI